MEKAFSEVSKNSFHSLHAFGHSKKGLWNEMVKHGLKEVLCWRDVDLHETSSERTLEESVTHIVEPRQFENGWICFDEAFKVDVVPFLDVVRIQWRPHAERKHRSIWKYSLKGKQQHNYIHFFQYTHQFTSFNSKRESQ